PPEPWGRCGREGQPREPIPKMPPPRTEPVPISSWFNSSDKKCSAPNLVDIYSRFGSKSCCRTGTPAGKRSDEKTAKTPGNVPDSPASRGKRPSDTTQMSGPRL